jgi:hypothetical protein
MTTNTERIQDELAIAQREAAEYRASGARDMNGRVLDVQAIVMDRVARNLLTADEADLVLQAHATTLPVDAPGVPTQAALAEFRGRIALSGANVAWHSITKARMARGLSLAEAWARNGNGAASATEREEGIPSYGGWMLRSYWYEQMAVMLTEHRVMRARHYGTSRPRGGLLGTADLLALCGAPWLTLATGEQMLRVVFVKADVTCSECLQALRSNPALALAGFCDDCGEQKQADAICICEKGIEAVWGQPNDLDRIADEMTGQDNGDPHRVGTCDPLCADLRCAVVQANGGLAADQYPERVSTEPGAAQELPAMPSHPRDRQGRPYPCDFWLEKSRSKCPEPSTVERQDVYGAPLRFCATHEGQAGSQYSLPRQHGAAREEH